jgi:hypothetical protein
MTALARKPDVKYDFIAPHAPLVCARACSAVEDASYAKITARSQML